MIDGKAGAEPDEAESDEACQIQRLVEIEPAHQELDSRVDVHEDAGQVVQDWRTPRLNRASGTEVTMPARGRRRNCGPDNMPRLPVPWSSL